MKVDFEINGFCDERFSAVKEAFAKNFEVDGDIGASFAVTLNGEFVVDLWGGYADKARMRPWKKDTIVNVYSTTKAMTIICALILVDRGLLELDAPVAKYWPEFTQNGKKKILVHHIFSHSSGLAGWDAKLKTEDLYNWEKVVNLLAMQTPWWEPGTKSGYHAITHGYLLGELVRRITGKSLGTFFREEIAGPLEADFHIGFGKEHDHRVADLIPWDLPKSGDSDFIDFNSNSIFARVFSNPIITTD
ncbi:MAG: serine hydrolase domain-containing protein, partial [Candidatus Ranarchaeia archaeon]